MAFAAVTSTVQPLFDDGAAFIFQFQDYSNNVIVSGVIHRPFSASQVDWMTTPPTTICETSDFGSWLETIKYAIRNQRFITLYYDDAASISYVPQWTGAQAITLNLLYAVTDVP